MPKVLVYDVAKCTGCRQCEIICSFRHKSVCGRNDSLIRIVSDDRALTNRGLFCHHCKKPVCVQLCPVGAIARDEEIGLVSIDIAKCMGCGLCTGCPLGGILMDEESGLARNCDLCGGSPACVEFCPPGALQYLLLGETRRLKVA